MKNSLSFLLTLGTTMSSVAGTLCQWSQLKFDGIPETAQIAFAAKGNRCSIVSTLPGSPRLWIGSLTANVFSGKEMDIPVGTFTSAWTWPEQITGVVTAYDKFILASSAGLFEVSLDGAIAPLWENRWDTSTDLRFNGANQLIWRVWSFGTASGQHFYSPDTGFQALYWWGGGSTTDPFGWWDIRGLISGGTNTPPLLLSSTGFSTSGGTNWIAYSAKDKTQIAALRAESDLASRQILLVTQDGGQVFYNNLGTGSAPFEDLNSPVKFPSTISFLEDGRIIVGDGTSTNSWLGTLTFDAIRLQITIQDSRSGVVTITALPGTEYVLENAKETTGGWLPVSTNTTPPIGTVRHPITIGSGGMFFRTRMLDGAKPF